MMISKKYLLAMGAILLLQSQAFSQRVLPAFDLIKGYKGSVVVSWKNNFGEDLVQVTIQRSTDSIKNFKTLFSPEAPGLSANGYTDKNPPLGKNFYRIMYMLKTGAYFFTQAVSEVSDANTAAVASNPLKDAVDKAPKTNVLVQNEFITMTRTRDGGPIITIPATYNPTLYSMDIINPLDPTRNLFHVSHFDENIFMLDRGVFSRAGNYNYVIKRITDGKVVEKGIIPIN